MEMAQMHPSVHAPVLEITTNHCRAGLHLWLLFLIPEIAHDKVCIDIQDTSPKCNPSDQAQNHIHLSYTLF